MNRRGVLSRAVLAMVLAALAASAAVAPAAEAQTSPQQPHLKEHNIKKPGRPGGWAVPQRGPSTPDRNPAEIPEDSDDQLDWWVHDCKAHGGGMITNEDGNYDCIDPQGNSLY